MSTTNVRLYKKVYILTFILALFAVFSAFSQNQPDKNGGKVFERTIQLEERDPDLVSVLGATVICQPIRTSYGYAAVGEGKQLYGFTSEGNLLWQRSFYGTLKPYLTIGPQDMMYMITKNSYLNMMNSSGLVLWSTKLPFEAIDAPFTGRDGRVFVRGRHNIACFGLDGIMRWNIKTEMQNALIKPQELNDGSYLIFLAKNDNSKTHAQIMSPFGSKLAEEIEFAGTVSDAASCTDGVLLSFTDGACGLCSVKDGSAVSQWTLSAQKSQMTEAAKILTDCQAGLCAFVWGKPATVTYIETATGKIRDSFQTRIANAQTTRFMGHTVQGLAICDSTKGECYTISGSKQWSVKFNPKRKWNFVYATDSGYLCFCLNDWILEAYRTKANLSGTKSSSFAEKKTRNYPYPPCSKTSSTFLGPAIDEKTQKEIRAGLSKGGYGEKEIQWMSLIQSELNHLYSDWTMTARISGEEKPYFRQNIEYTQTVIDIASSVGISFERKKLATLLKKAEDQSMKICLIRACKKQAYDPDGVFLDTMEYLIKNRVQNTDLSTLDEICDAVYEICRYMGRPVFFEKGQAILGYLLYPQYNERTRQKARETLKKIKESKL